VLNVFQHPPFVGHCRCHSDDAATAALSWGKISVGRAGMLKPIQHGEGVHHATPYARLAIPCLSARIGSPQKRKRTAGAFTPAIL
jgi:hypothetical protein